MSISVTRAKRLSELYYNRGLDLARIRDLSGAAETLRLSIRFDKTNINARNLLGLVYHETGEVVAALQEWVVSSNLQPAANPASAYIAEVRKNPKYLSQMNQLIKAYNGALRECRDGNDDVAAITLRRIASRNPKYVRAMLLLALVDIHEKHYSHARRILRKVIRTDRHNPLALRYLQEIDEQLGTSTSFELRVSDISGKKSKKEKPADFLDEMELENAAAASPERVRPERQRPAWVNVANLLIGLAVGIFGAWFVIAPSVRSSLNRNANEKIVDYTTTMATQEDKISDLQSQIDASNATAKDAEQKVQDSSNATASYDSLLQAYSDYQNGDYENAGDEIAKVDVSLLSTSAGEIYDSIKDSINSAAYNEYVNSGSEAFYLQNWSEAAAQFEKAIAITPEDYDSLNLLAQAYQNNGDNDKAVETYQKIIDTFPNTRRSEYAAAAIEQLGGSVQNSSEVSSGEDSSGDYTDDTAAAENTADTGDTTYTDDTGTADDEG